jgi:hypothetical protein
MTRDVITVNTLYPVTHTLFYFIYFFFKEVARVYVIDGQRDRKLSEHIRKDSPPSGVMAKYRVRIAWK